MSKRAWKRMLPTLFIAITLVLPLAGCEVAWNHPYGRYWGTYRDRDDYAYGRPYEYREHERYERERDRRYDEARRHERREEEEHHERHAYDEHGD